jgi:hypothetical protein
LFGMEIGPIHHNYVSPYAVLAKSKLSELSSSVANIPPK